ncbi:MAG: cupin domain-containing protein [Ginsengibacter sp.]
MEMKEAYSCDKYKVLNVTLNVGEKMPLHEATSDAFLICKKGKGRVTFSDRIVEICQGDTLLINAHEHHKLEILEDFSACIILESDGRINFIKNQELALEATVY